MTRTMSACIEVDELLKWMDGRGRTRYLTRQAQAHGECGLTTMRENKVSGERESKANNFMHACTYPWCARTCRASKDIMLCDNICARMRGACCVIKLQTTIHENVHLADLCMGSSTSPGQAASLRPVSGFATGVIQNKAMPVSNA